MAMELENANGSDHGYVIDDGDDQYDLGVKGQQKIRKMLSQHNPVNVIHEFQDRNGLRFPNTDAVLKFLDLLGISRSQIYASLNEKLLTHLLSRLSKAKEEQKQELLRASFRYIRVPGLCQVPIQLLRDRASIPSECLQQLAQNTAVLDTLPLTIVREIWAAYPNLFIAKLVDIFNRYVDDPVRIKSYQSYYQAHIAPAVGDRRSSDPILQQLADWIGTSFALYDIALRTIRDRFTATNHFGYCVLRMELLMCLHDMGTSTIVALDPIHQLTWCLNAACRERVIEGRLMNEFATQYVQLKEGGDIPDSGELPPELIVQLQDLSMVLAHPLVINVLLRSIESCLSRIVHLAQDDLLPKDDDQLRVLTQALYVGCNVRKLLRVRRQFKLPKCPHTVFRKLYSLLGILILNGTASPDSLIAALANDKGQIGLCVVMAFATSYLSSYDYKRVSVLLAVIGRVDAPSAATLSPFNRFISSIISNMIQDCRHRSQLCSSSAFRHEFCHSFLLKIASRSEHVRPHCYDLLASVSTMIPVSDLASYLIALHANSDKDLPKHPVYDDLLTQIPELADAIAQSSQSITTSNHVPDNQQPSEERTSEIADSPTLSTTPMSD